MNTLGLLGRILQFDLFSTEIARQEIDDVQHEMALVVLRQVHGCRTINLRCPTMTIIEVNNHANTLGTEEVHTNKNWNQHCFCIKPRLIDFLRIWKHKH